MAAAVAQITLASFLASHVTPFGSVTGSVLTVRTLEAEGISPPLAADAMGVTTLVSSTALIALFGAGFAATAGRHLSRGYLTIAAVALALVACVLALIFLMGARPASRSGRDAGPPGWRGACGRASTRTRSAGPAAG